VPGVDLVWRKSTRSETAFCVELARNGVDNYIRDSKNPGQKLDMPAHAVHLLISLVSRRSWDVSQDVLFNRGAAALGG
jgi:hypothetical protein